MTKRSLRSSTAALSVLAFVSAGALMLGVSYLAARMIEARTETTVQSRLVEARMDWVTVAADGLQLRLTGTAPSEAARFRALNLVGSIIDSSRLRDALDVTPTKALLAPRFSVELLRNDDGIQLIGLMPEQADSDGMTAPELVAAAAALTADDVAPADMLQSAAWPAPQKWDQALRFGLEALGRLKRSKISVDADRVVITAIAANETEKRQLMADLNRRKPAGLNVSIEISAPRPVITPFTLRFIKDEAGARFDACSADTMRTRAQILAAAASAGMAANGSCTIGLGAPSPRWGEGAVAAIRAVNAMGAGTVTFSDADISLIAGEGVSQADFDSAVGDLRQALPDVFSLNATRPLPDATQQGPLEFTARMVSGGRVELRGLVVDDPQQAAVDAFARAMFGDSRVHLATRLDASLPDGWPVRVLAGLESLAQLSEGSLLVRADLVEVKGVTGSQEARARITQILSARLGQGQRFTVDIRYDEALDPLAALPTPQECAAEVTAVMAAQKITFTPASAEISGDSAPVIAKLAEVLADCPALPFEIAGHTDSQGSEGGNQALSQARAEAVLIALTGRRVDTSGMVAKGYGEANPIADNRSEEGREANRRIEFTLIEAALKDLEPAPVPTGREGAEPLPPAVAPEEDGIVFEDDGADESAAPMGMPEDDAAEGETAPSAELEPGMVELAPGVVAGDAPPPSVETPPTVEAEAGAPDMPQAELPEITLPPLVEGEAPVGSPDFSDDLSPSVAPSSQTIRPAPRSPAVEAAAQATGSDAPSAEAGASPESETPSEAAVDGADETGADSGGIPALPQITAPQTPEGAPPVGTPDFSQDTSPSVAPTEMTIRPQPRPAGRDSAGE